MRRAAILLTILLTLCLLTGCTLQPDLLGRWETAPEETLCATVLFLSSRDHFTLIQAGRSQTGSWRLTGNQLILTFSSGGKSESPGELRCTLDRRSGTIDIGSGLRLYRQPDPDLTGYWHGDSDASGKMVSLLLTDSGYFLLQRHDTSLASTTLDGGDYLEGQWTLGGLTLTLKGTDGQTAYCSLSADGQRIFAYNAFLERITE